MAEPSHLIVFLPGIGGTCLAYPSAGGGPRRHDDGQPVYAWSAGVSDMGLLIHPDRLSVERVPRLVPVGLVPSRKAFGVWTAIHGYDGVLRRLATGGPGGSDLGVRPEAPNLDATFVAMGYDFRLGMVDAAERVHDQIAARVEHLWPMESDRVRRVIVVGHSMGGLVARYWAGVLDEHAWCREVITLGTPHRGAPKALQILANGLPLNVVFPHLTSVLRGWQGIYDLLPRYPAIVDLTRPGAVTAAGQDGSSLVRVTDLPLNWDTDRVRAAMAAHATIDQGWDQLGVNGPGLTYRVGFGHRTLQRCLWDGKRVDLSKASPLGPGLGEWATVAGDGTVPGFCAVPIGRDNDPVAGIVTDLRHGPMATLTELDELLRQIRDKGSLDFYRAGGEEQLSLGLDLPTLTPAGEPVRLTAEVWRRHGTGVEVVSQDHADAAVWATIRRIGPEGVPSPASAHDLRLSWDPTADAFTAEFQPREPGLVEVIVAAPSVSDHRASETLQVLDPVLGG